MPPATLTPSPPEGPWIAMMATLYSYIHANIIQLYTCQNQSYAHFLSPVQMSKYMYWGKWFARPPLHVVDKQHTSFSIHVHNNPIMSTDTEIDDYGIHVQYTWPSLYALYV